ncbi:MAG TPA: heavy metal translocating P-type ATPase [Spirochaetota bacterium]|nr:heavy metal translocating P-type ATPase [Spirochaetota bacterium]
MKKYKIDNLDCANCALIIERELQKSPKVSFASLNYATGTLTIDTSDINEVKKIISGVEYGVSIRESAAPAAEKSGRIRDAIMFASALILFVAGWLTSDGVIHLPLLMSRILYYLAWVLAGYNVILMAFTNTLRAKVFDENFLMTLTTIGAFVIGANSEGAAVMLFYKAGELLQEYAVNRSRRSIESLLALRPDYANVRRGGEIIRVSPEDLTPGELIIVKSGERIPVDGTVMSGSSWIDTSALTGESVPRAVSPDEMVLSGSVNTGSVLDIRVDKPYSESSVARILELVENSSQRKARTEKFITVFARYYTPVVVVAAALVAVIPPLAGMGSFSHWLYRAFVLLVISCPCALVVSIPLGYFGGIGGASRKGILVKGSAVLDALAKVKTVVFDKTGTLTQGKLFIAGISPANGFSEEDLIMYAGAAEMHSNHPIAAVLSEAGGGNVRAEEISHHREIAGSGVIADIRGHSVIVGNEKFLRKKKIGFTPCRSEETVVYAAIDGVYAGYISFGDIIKDDAHEAVERLRASGVKSFMITGDSAYAADKVAVKLGISDYRAGLLPEGKVTELERIIESAEGKVAFAGDGINDAPVITRADVGIAMGQFGSAAAVECADMVLMTDSPVKIHEAISHAKRTRKIVIQNIVFALGVKLGFAALGIAGIATMWEAVFADVGVALIAVVNASRAMRV